MFSPVDLKERLVELLTRKLPTIKAKSTYEAKAKLIRFGVSRGFDMEMVVDCATQLISEE
jgi:regulatory protein